MKTRNRVEAIMKQVLEYLEDKPLEERFKHSLVMSNTIYNSLTPMEQVDLKNNIQIGCKGNVVHNDFVPEDFIAIVNSFLPVTDTQRVYKLNLD